jgi:hypothetical protein
MILNVVFDPSFISPGNFEKCLPSRAEKILDCNLQDVLPYRCQQYNYYFLPRGVFIKFS